MNMVAGRHAGTLSQERRGGAMGLPDVAVLLARVVLAAVAGFWGWFVVMVAASEGWGSAGPAFAIGGPLVGVAGAAWVWPRGAGVVAVVAGVVAAVVFGHWSPRVMMAAPLVVAGVVLVVWGAGARGRAGGRAGSARRPVPQE